MKTAVLCLAGVLAVALGGHPCQQPGMFIRPPHLDAPRAPRVTTLDLSPALYDTMSVPFVPHEGGGPFSNYLTMNIPYPPVKSVFLQVKRALRLRRFKTRGEAHITVITPPEYTKILSKRLSMRDIDAIALENSIQEARFKVIGLGSGSATMNGKKEETFFLVVASPRLTEIRRQVAQLFEARGGAVGAFDAEHFYPHITVGFTKRDLHEADGIIKGPESLDSRFSL